MAIFLIGGMEGNYKIVMMEYVYHSGVLTI